MKRLSCVCRSGGGSLKVRFVQIDVMTALFKADGSSPVFFCRVPTHGKSAWMGIFVPFPDSTENKSRGIQGMGVEGRAMLENNFTTFSQTMTEKLNEKRLATCGRVPWLKMLPILWQSCEMTRAFIGVFPMWESFQIRKFSNFTQKKYMEIYL